jgi:hypothetical protein
MTTAKQVFNSLVAICNEMETRQPYHTDDKEECEFFRAQKEAAKEIRILLGINFPHLWQT